MRAPPIVQSARTTPIPKKTCLLRPMDEKQEAIRSG